MIATLKITLFSLLVAASIQTQKTNFAGTWVPAAKPGNEMVVAQDDKQITIEYFTSGKSVRRDEIVLDGVPHRRTIPVRGAEVVMLYKATWQAGRLVITTDTAYPNGMKTAGTETWSIDAKGQLVIDAMEKVGEQSSSNQMILSRKK